MSIHIAMKHVPNLDKIEVEIKYQELSDEVREIEHFIQELDYYLIAEMENCQVKIRLSDIYYFESVDKKTYVYTINEVYRIRKSLGDLLEDIGTRGFTRVSKSLIVNISMLVHVRNVANSRLEATLKNGEKLIISRSYLKDIKKKIRTGGIL